MESSKQTNISEFWEWFSTTADELSQNLDNDRILSELDQRVSKLGDIVWEVGPGVSSANALVISPGGKESLLALTDAIVELAPLLKDWEFHSSKPPKHWELQLVVEGNHGQAIPIDARDWEYVLLGFPDGTFDIKLLAPSLTRDQRIRDCATAVVVESQIGERMMLEYINYIEVVESFDPSEATKKNSINVLLEHLKDLVAN